MIRCPGVTWVRIDLKFNLASLRTLRTLRTLCTLCTMLFLDLYLRNGRYLPTGSTDQQINRSIKVPECAPPHPSGLLNTNKSFFAIVDFFFIQHYNVSKAADFLARTYESNFHMGKKEAAAFGNLFIAPCRDKLAIKCIFCIFKRPAAVLNGYQKN